MERTIKRIKKIEFKSFFTQSFCAHTLYITSSKRNDSKRCIVCRELLHRYYDATRLERIQGFVFRDYNCTQRKMNKITKLLLTIPHIKYVTSINFKIFKFYIKIKRNIVLCSITGIKHIPLRMDSKSIIFIL